MTKINHTLDRSREWSFDMYVDPNATPEVKMAAAWEVILDMIGSEYAADMDVKKIETQNASAGGDWHIVTVACSKRALRAFEAAAE